jgi:hypothetical protein
LFLSVKSTNHVPASDDETPQEAKMTHRIPLLIADQFLIIAWLLLCLIAPKDLFAQNLRAVDVVPDQERRSCIQVVDGYAQLSENMTLAETRAAALANAKRHALEAGRTYVKSKTKVKDFEVEYDMVWADAEGAVTILEQEDHGVENNTRYHVWIKAEVEYALRPKRQEAGQAMLLDKDAPLTVKVWTSKKQYKHGENINIFVKGNRDFYARIVDISSSGQIVQLLPNAYRRINFFEAGQVYRIPGAGDRFDLRVRAPYGEDQIVVYASEVPVGHVGMESLSRGLSRFMGSQETLATESRSIAVVGAEDSHSGAEFYEATWTVITSLESPTTDDSRGRRKADPDEPIPMTGGTGTTEPMVVPGKTPH